MVRVTNELQATIPRAIAERYGIKPGQEIEWLEVGDVILVVPPAGRSGIPDRKRRLDLFDRATERQRDREAARGQRPRGIDRGWRRAYRYRDDDAV
jgi:bifunctional DNA-binding transcriptional regulator/antitoxin component of YhaV-PrlF toxin-antitoxin module